MSADFTPPSPGHLGLGGIMSAALAMYRAAPRPFLAVSLVSTLPLVGLSVAGDLAYGVPADSTGRGLRELILLVPALFLVQISLAATAVLTMDLLHRRPPSASAGLELVGLRFWPLAAVNAITILGVALGIMALVIPGLVLLVMWIYAPIIAVVEARRPRASLARSVATVRGRFWWTTGAYVAIQLTVTLAGILIGALFGTLAAPLSGNAAIIGTGLAELVAVTLVQPVALLGVALMYLEGRAAREGHWANPGSQPE